MAKERQLMNAAYNGEFDKVVELLVSDDVYVDCEVTHILKGPFGGAPFAVVTDDKYIDAATPFIAACAGGHILLAEELIKRGADKKYTTPGFLGGYNAAHVAAYNGHPDMVIYLCSKHGFDLGMRDADGFNVFHAGAGGKKPKACYKLKAFNDLYVKGSKYQDQQNGLLLAVQDDNKLAVEYLIRYTDHNHHNMVDTIQDTVYEYAKLHKKTNIIAIFDKFDKEMGVTEDKSQQTQSEIKKPAFLQTVLSNKEKSSNLDTDKIKQTIIALNKLGMQSANDLSDCLRTILQSEQKGRNLDSALYKQLTKKEYAFKGEYKAEKGSGAYESFKDESPILTSIKEIGEALDNKRASEPVIGFSHSSPYRV